MPKKFPPAPDNVHPAATASRADSLADLLFDGADVADVAEHLRLQDEPNANLLAPLLVLMVEALPVFRRAIADGETATHNKIEAQDVLRALERSRPADFTSEGLARHRKMLADTAEEVRHWGQLDEARTIAMCALHYIGVTAPALYEDPRGERLAKTPATLEELQATRLAIVNYAVEHGLELDTSGDWPRSIRQIHATRGRVRLVTVEKVPAGLRVS